MNGHSFGHAQPPAQLDRPGRRLDIGHPADVLQTVGAAAVVGTYHRVIRDRVQVGLRDADVDLGPLGIVRPPRRKVFGPFELSAINVRQPEIGAAVAKLVAKRALVHGHQASPAFDEGSDRVEGLRAQAGGIGQNQHLVL